VAGYQRFPRSLTATLDERILAIFDALPGSRRCCAVWKFGKNQQEEERSNMTRKTMIAGAAIAGLMSGSFAMTAQAVQSSAKAGVSIKMGDKDKAPTDKHGCKGMNSCKGKGGCKTGDNGCKGKNSCKGKGGCATDGSHAEEPKKEEPKK
jgi:hypothetical protein